MVILNMLTKPPMLQKPIEILRLQAAARGGWLYSPYSVVIVTRGFSSSFVAGISLLRGFTCHEKWPPTERDDNLSSMIVNQVAVKQLKVKLLNHTSHEHKHIYTYMYSPQCIYIYTYTLGRGVTIYK